VRAETETGRRGAVRLPKLEDALRFLRRMAVQVDVAGPKLRAGIRTGSVREYWHPRCTCVSELECLDVRGPSPKNIFSDNRSGHSLTSRGDGSRPVPARPETRMPVHR
jgi:hypothetical protein